MDCIDFQALFSVAHRFKGLLFGLACCLSFPLLAQSPDTRRVVVIP